MHNLHIYKRMCSYTHTYIQTIIYTLVSISKGFTSLLEVGNAVHMNQECREQFPSWPRLSASPQKWVNSLLVGWLLGCLTSQQHASVSQGRICSNKLEDKIEVADQTFHLTQSQYTDTGPSADPIAPGAWQGNHWSASFEVTGMTRPRKNPGASGISTRDLPLSRWTP